MSQWATLLLVSPKNSFVGKSFGVFNAAVQCATPSGCSLNINSSTVSIDLTGFLTLGSSSIQADSVDIKGIVSYSTLNLTANSLTIGANGKISGDGGGYPSDFGPGAGGIGPSGIFKFFHHQIFSLLRWRRRIWWKWRSRIQKQWWCRLWKRF